MLLDPIAYWLEQIGVPLAPTDISAPDPVQQAPQKQAAHLVMQRGRSVNAFVDATGHWHLRRRARQVRREFGSCVQWAAFPKATQGVYGRRRWKHPWWWI